MAPGGRQEQLERSTTRRVVEPGRRRPRIPDADGFTGIRGDLGQMSLPALLAHLEAERRSGLLFLRVRAWENGARLELREGRLLRARLHGLPFPRNAELVYALLEAGDGRFDFQPCPVDAGDEIGLPVTALLLEGARRQDEFRRRDVGGVESPF